MEVEPDTGVKDLPEAKKRKEWCREEIISQLTAALVTWTWVFWANVAWAILSWRTFSKFWGSLFYER
jgi:hypothetical protein